MKKINAKKGEFVDLFNGLIQVKDLQGKDFGLVVGKNITILQQNLKDLEDAGRPSKEFLQLSMEVNSIINKDSEEGKEQLDKLEKDNKKLVEERRTQLDDLAKLMEESMEMELYTIEEDKLPDNISGSQVMNINKILM